MSSSQGCWLTWDSWFWFKWNIFSMWFISKQIKPKKSWTVSDASHFLLEKISEAHKMSPALTIYQVILIYGSQWTVRNGGERWRAYNIYFFSRTVYQRAFFSPFIHNSGTASPPPCFRKKKREKMKEEKKSAYLYYIMFSKQQIPSASYLWVCSPSSGTCCIFWVPVFVISQSFCSEEPWMGPLWGADR